MKKILFTGPQSNLPAKAAALLNGFEIDFIEEQVTEKILLDMLKENSYSAFLMNTNPPLTRKVIEAAKDVKIIAKLGVGYDSLDIKAAHEHNIIVTIASGENAMATAEQAMALMLAVRRELVPLDNSIRTGQWTKETYWGKGLDGAVLGIIGLGRIGKKVAEIAKVFGMEVITLERSDKKTSDTDIKAYSHDEFFSKADIVSLHCPLNDKTRKLIDAKTIRKMKDNVIIINTSRGAVIDEQALADALNSGKIFGAGLDTFSIEPIKQDNPVLKAKNVIMTPHIAANTEKSIEDVAMSAADSVLRVLRGESPLEKNIIYPR